MAASSPASPITPTSSSPSPQPLSFDWWWTARFHSPNSTLDLSATPSGAVSPIHSSITAWWEDFFLHNPTSPTYTPANSAADFLDWPADSPDGYYPPNNSPAAVDLTAAFSPMSPTWPPTYSPAAAYSSPCSRPNYGSPSPPAPYWPSCSAAAYSLTSPAYGPCPAAYSPTPNYGPEASDVDRVAASRAQQRSPSYYFPMSPGPAHRRSTALYSPASAWSAYCAAGFNDGSEGTAPADGGAEMAPAPPEPEYCYFCSTTLQDCRCQIGDDDAAPAPAP